MVIYSTLLHYLRAALHLIPGPGSVLEAEIILPTIWGCYAISLGTAPAEGSRVSQTQLPVIREKLFALEGTKCPLVLSWLWGRMLSPLPCFYVLASEAMCIEGG